jgi:hypothetical protein
MRATTAREHAVRASELLNQLEQGTGAGVDVLELAQAHACVALGLCMTEEDPDPDDAQGARFTK